MSNVIPFPIRDRIVQLAEPPPAEPPPSAAEPRMDKILSVIWNVTAVCWSFMRFVLPLIVLWQFVRMLWFWNSPGVHAGWRFLAYFAGYTALYYFVAFYRPKALRDHDATRGGRHGRR